jgi:hypothetical protein|tara:strand:- start:2322 stop:2660 length:339 start_codon:yes stop_codon:yes gene_type:complete
MKNKQYLIFVIICSMSFLNSCSPLKKGLGLEKDVPNEFLIQKRDSLLLPPDYKMLPPDSQAGSRKDEGKESEYSLQSVLNKNLNKDKEEKPENKYDKDISQKTENEILKQIK